MKNNYYEILSISPSSTYDEIRSAYRQLSKHYHPDLNTAPNAAIMFRLITEAHDVLCDTVKRAQYDHDLNVKPNDNQHRPTAEDIVKNHANTNAKSTPFSSSKDTSSKHKPRINVFSSIGAKILYLFKFVLLTVVILFLRIVYALTSFLLPLIGGLSVLAGKALAVLCVVVGVFNFFMRDPSVNLFGLVLGMLFLMFISGILIFVGDKGEEWINDSIDGAIDFFVDIRD